jgi:hypothetical protein
MNLQQILEREVRYIGELGLPAVKETRLLQQLYRSLTFDSQIYSLLHGSSAITERGNAVVFGDGVDCIGKTSTALAVAKSSGKFIVDEYTLYNQLTGNIYGNRYLPLHIRNGNECTHELPQFAVVDTVKLSAVVCPKPSDSSRMVMETDFVSKAKKLSILANAHRLKFIENGLDRVNGETDEVKKVDILDYVFGYQVPQSLLGLPYYDAYLKTPEDIIELLRKENL